MKKLKNKVIKISILILIILAIYQIRINASTIVLDPGHGGNDFGAVNVRKNIKEAEVNYKIATYLKEYLEQYKDVKIILTRSKTEYKTLQQRANVAFSNNADLLISLHINSADSGTPTGACGFVTYKTNFDKYNKQCTKISNMILNNLSKLGIKNNGTNTRVCKDNTYKWLYSDGSHADYYGIIRYCMKGTAGDGPKVELDINSGKGIPVVLVEHCYIKNGDEQYIDSDDKIEKLAKCDADAIAQYYNLVSNGTSNINKNNTTTKKEPSISIPKKITISSVKNINSKKAKIDWKKDTYVNSYEIYMATAKIDNAYMKTKNNLKLRKSKSTHSKSLKTIPKGTKIKILKRNVKKFGKYYWYKVTYNGKTGYVSSQYLEKAYKEGSYSKIKTITNNQTTSYTKSGLKKGKIYTFKIRSYKTVDNKKIYGNYSNVKWITIKK